MGIVSVCLLLFMGIVTASTIFVGRQFKLFSNQIRYLQDTNSVIQSEITTLQKSMEQTLRKESSAFSDWNIEVIDTDFASSTYTVSISLIPKEYTEETQASIYFGTSAFELEKNGFSYIGEATLGLDTAVMANQSQHTACQQRNDNQLTHTHDTITHSAHPTNRIKTARRYTDNTC